ncbi:hypothetical protein GpartN1_g7298.t1 [Galdieria partita]|uniref:CTLH domain-containing protein n=1 Tax=Galdieria partita TaxID=83374 RepID=A0A9C7Q5Y8_9RHOD|nr:hypothetical protein GpartN1_g7298.t1 [Galdieria partita]
MQSTTNRRVFSKEEWEKKLSQVQVDRRDLNLLVMNYLVVEGYKDAAEKFSEETGLDPGVDLKSIAERMAIRTAVQRGEIDKAVELVNDVNPLILDSNPSLFFHLQLQKLIELIRQGDIEQALKFAQEELAPKGEENPSFLEELERVMALLAFEDRTSSPVGYLLQQSQRQKTASELNQAILTSLAQEKDPRLPSLLKTLLWAQEQLKSKAIFPEMDITTGVLSDPPKE